jgi:type I restriction enzyme S subunit
MSKELRELANVYYGESPAAVLDHDGLFPILGTGGEYGKANKSLYNGPAIVVPRKGSLGNPQLVEQPFWPVDTTYAVIPKAGVDAAWLFYNLDLFDLRRLNEATGVPSISRDWLYRIVFHDPGPVPQREIGIILRSIDQSISCSATLICKYQKIKAGLMHNLFTRGLDDNGQLRRPRAEAPERYKATSIGWIPVDWVTTRIDNVGTVQLGRQRSPDQHSGKWTMPYLRVANVFDGFIDYSDVLQMDFTPAERRSFSLRAGDILLNEGQSLELVGRSAMYEGPDEAFCFQNTLVRFRPNEGQSALFYRGLFKLWLDTGRFVLVAKQTTSVAHLGASRFARMVAPQPCPEEQEMIAERLGKIETALQTEENCKQKLEYLKAGLMQHLLSGDAHLHAIEPCHV